MNKSIIFIFLPILFTIGCTSSIKTDEDPPKETHPLSIKLDEYFSALTDIDKFNGAVLVQKDGETIFMQAYNMNSDTNSKMHVTENSQFDIHSISKLIAKACIVKLENAKLISRADLISKYIPNYPNGKSITIQHLLDNQSGLPRELTETPSDLIDKTPEQFVDLIKQEELLFAPGSETLYSNLGFQLVYYAISKVTGKPFVQYAKDELFDPLQMDRSGAHFHMDKSNLTQAIINHVLDNDEIISVPNFERTGKNQSKVYSTLHDLLKFINEMKKEPYRSQLINQAGNIGWSGGGEGILSHAEAKLKSGYELIFFSNYDEISFGRILEDVEKIMTNQSYILPAKINRKAVTVDKEIIEKYVGKFDMAEFDHDEFEIRIEKDSVAFYQNDEFGGMLKAENDSTFFGEPTDENYFIFRELQNGDFTLIFKYKGVDIVGKRK